MLSSFLVFFNSDSAAVFIFILFFLAAWYVVIFLSGHPACSLLFALITHMLVDMLLHEYVSVYFMYLQ